MMWVTRGRAVQEQAVARRLFVDEGDMEDAHVEPTEKGFSLHERKKEWAVHGVCDGTTLVAAFPQAHLKTEIGFVNSSSPPE